VIFDGNQQGRNALENILPARLNAKILIGFLERLTRKQRKKVFLILDNLRVHHSKLVQRWLAENAEKIEVF